jgi:hypothetical protein
MRSFISWQWLSRTLGLTRPAPRRRPARPCLESLEVRCVPVIYFLQTTPLFTEAVPYSGPIAKFGDTVKQAASSYQLSIDWGDGTRLSNGTVALGTDGYFTVNGTHTYAVDTELLRNFYVIKLTVQDPSTGKLYVKETSVGVAEPVPKFVSPFPVVTGSGRLVNGVATRTLTAFFIDTDGPPLVGSASTEFTGTLSWGDKTFDTPLIQLVGQSGNTFTYKVTASHQYTKPGEYLVSLNINHAPGANFRQIDGNIPLVLNPKIEVSIFT